MSTINPKILTLTEYALASFAPDEIFEEAAQTIFREYGNKIEIEWPTPKTNMAWQLRSQGWVGQIPVTPELMLIILPKVALTNLFRMLEYAYQLKSFQLLEGLVECATLSEFYERLANILAKRVLRRGRQGFYRTYIPYAEQLPYIRGRLDVRHTLRAPWAVHRECHYEDHTADIEDNQLLMWTLWRIIRSGICTERVMPTIRQAYRSLQGLANLSPFTPQDCVKRLYHRLNEDYHALHALCHFFLEHSGPSYPLGDRTMLPFLVDMARLYERFVAEWLKVHLPSEFSLKVQERVVFENNTLYCDIDLVLTHLETGVTYVLDTKYKTPSYPSTDDIAQLNMYAGLKNSRNGILIYPIPMEFETKIGDVRIRSMTFALDGDLDQAGQAFWGDLLGLMG